ncbi:hypothetical protein T492DRAFT_1004274 [Pavlovales sp. CCMP2436]|nr:hypothetical protein T492DRAFT_1004274 [Pavlovales sp. CCMP2436]
MLNSLRRVTVARGARPPPGRWVARGVAVQASPWIGPMQRAGAGAVGARGDASPAIAIVLRPGECDLRAPDAEQFAGHAVFFRDIDGVNRMGILRERKSKFAWVTDHVDGISVVHPSDVTSFWRLRKPLKAQSTVGLRKELSAIFSRVQHYAAEVARNAEAARATLSLPLSTESRRFEIRNLRELADPLLGLGEAVPTNMQLMAIHHGLMNEPGCMVRFKPFSHGIAFVARTDDGLACAQAAVKRNARFALTPAEQVRMLARLRECALARDFETYPVLRDAEAARSKLLRLARTERMASALESGGASGPAAGPAPLFLSECLDCPAAKLALYTAPQTLTRAAMASQPAAAGHMATPPAQVALPPDEQPDAADTQASAQAKGAAVAEPAELAAGTAVAEPAPVAPFGQCALEQRVLAELQTFAMVDDFDEGYVSHEPLVSLLLWPLCRRDRPWAAFEVLVRLGELAPFTNLNRERLVREGAVLHLAALAKAELPREPAADATAAAAEHARLGEGFGLLQALPQWALDGSSEPPPDAHNSDYAHLAPRPRRPAHAAPCSLVVPHALQVVTIDGPTAEEIDDGVSAEPSPDGLAAWVHVHVANPTVRIPAYSALDDMAALRAKTVYLPEGSVPMLPAALARGEGGTGLEPTDASGAPRSALTFSARVCLSTGALLQYKVAETALGSVLALTYQAADELLASGDALAATAGAGGESGDGVAAGAADAVAEPGSVVGTLALLERVARARKARRMAAGAVSPTLPRPNPRVDPVTLEVRLKSSDDQMRSGSLIEEMMVLAGEVCAELAATHELPVAFRAQQLPTDERTEEQQAGMDTLRRLGKAAAARPPRARATGAVVEDEDIEWLLASVAIVPLLRAATVSVAPAGGHASLGLRGYVQVTSPLRRYLDLVAHHQVRQLLARAGGTLEGAPLDEAQFALVAMRLQHLGEGGADAADARAREMGLPYTPREVDARAQHVTARSQRQDRLESISSRYWTMQYLAQSMRDGVDRFDAIALTRETTDENGTAVLVLLPAIGMRAWVREFDCEPGTRLRVRVHKLHAHRAFIGLIPCN